MNYAHTRVGAQKHTPPNVPRQRFGSKIGRVLGVSLLGKVKPGAFLVYPGGGEYETGRIMHIPV